MNASAAPRSGTSAGSGVVITHPDKMLFPDAGITKAEVAAYYELVAPMLIEHIRGRPVTLERYPQGIAAKGFIQKNLGRGTPSWLERVEVPRQDGGLVVYPLINDPRALQWLANQNCITPHVWTSRTPALGQPDLCVFDLDPAVDDPTVLRAAALAVRDLLEELGLPSWVKTSGSKGFHIVVPLDAKADFEDVGRFAYGVASALVTRDPDHLTLEFIKVDRAGRIFVDVGRNGFGATFAAPYAVRPLPGAPVSAPCTWDEVASGAATPQVFTLRSMTARLEKHGDLWSEMSRRRRSLRTATARLRKMLGAAWSEDPRAIQAGQRRTAMREGQKRWLASRRATAT